MNELHSAAIVLGLGGLVLAFLPPVFSMAGAPEPAEVERISAEKARSQVLAGEAFLVCSYDDEKCSGMMLEGALTKTQFEKRLPSLSKDQGIITYCS
jgi:hypothetical protein